MAHYSDGIGAEDCHDKLIAEALLENFVFSAN